MGRQRGRVGSDPGLQTVQEGHSQRGDAGVQARRAGVLRRVLWPGPGAGRGKGCGEREGPLSLHGSVCKGKKGGSPTCHLQEQQLGVREDSSPQTG